MAKPDKVFQAYLQRLEENPADAEALTKLAALYQERKENAAAAECYGRLADLIAEQGMAIRAVPLYKQALKLDTTRIDLNLSLAQQYQQMGLKPDAMAQMELVCTHYAANNQPDAQLELLSHMVLLDPDNVALRVRKAELCVDQGQKEEAISELTKACGYLKRNNRIEEYVKVGERLIFLDPANVALGRELAQIYLATGESKRALAKLQACFNADASDVETLHLLGQAFTNLEQPAKAAKIYKELARIHAEADQTDEEHEAWEKVRALAPNDPDLPRQARR
jgi:predicted Zn-dependent protease